jgi:hypothetical protein
MAKRRVPVPAARDSQRDGELVMPRELTYRRAGSWASDIDFLRARRAWFRAHGIDDVDWSTVLPVLVASKRAHARSFNELDVRARLAWVAAHGPDAPYPGPPAA